MSRSVRYLNYESLVRDGDLIGEMGSVGHENLVTCGSRTEFNPSKRVDDLTHRRRNRDSIPRRYGSGMMKPHLSSFERAAVRIPSRSQHVKIVRVVNIMPMVVCEADLNDMRQDGSGTLEVGVGALYRDGELGDGGSIADTASTLGQRARVVKEERAGEGREVREDGVHIGMRLNAFRQSPAEDKEMMMKGKDKRRSERSGQTRPSAQFGCQ
ncbi:hypothetical protein C8R45DRAFT_944176 [Mycena sanguinolenta]|nr:hypothetical protein C8R45DRAFT_944176 [Mycena sanguinolenta]